MKVFYTAASRADLVEIAAWIAQENNVRAESFVDEIQRACDALGDMPRAYRVLFRRFGSSIRRKPFRSYLIFYRIRRSHVEILHVVHAARDYRKIPFRE